MAEIVSFSAALRERSSNAHGRGEHTGFMADLLAGHAGRDDYTLLVAQHYFVYAALEEAAERMREDAVASVFLSDRLTRLPALEADLEFLLGERWRSRIAPLPSTERYAARIEQVGRTWAGGFVAHHYTRYLGDLAGGTFIGHVLQRRFGFETNGIGFLLFDDIADPRGFTHVYREQLDAAPWSDEERERVIAEVLRAYRCNTELFADLDRVRAAA